MTHEKGDQLRDQLPDWVAGRLEGERAAALARAVEADPDLRAEADLLRVLRAGRADVPDGLDVRIAAAVLRDRRGSPAPAILQTARPRWWSGVWGPAWAVAAAAALVLFLGTWELVDRTGAPEEVNAVVTALEGRHTPWVADDGTVAGAAVLDGLSEEALASLLEEMGG